MSTKLKACWPQLLFLLIMLGILGLTTFEIIKTRPISDAFGTETLHVLVIDPGHGGIDGGAISDDGTKESDLNLAIGVKTKLIADLLGQSVLMTREDDSARTDFASYSEHEDLVHRTKLINDTPGAIVISIHQNDFPTGQPSGAQVLYSAFQGSDVLGRQTHANLVRLLDPENRRVAEPAPRSLYIMQNACCPVILVECGFMSNNFEVLKLCDERYQSSIALILIASFLQYENTTENA